ncbi:hypothetical protein JTE90_000264 [Oedothorax gibbosus]|uniref:Uncharacterized protein n=1 Tax=Oedothorax gibbosus TaxID=931172 RepID=A0AAV6VUF2_9ARAC|nr:hypothetical protein JTE90_000264 [Oedothorax gibbosus]
MPPKYLYITKSYTSNSDTSSPLDPPPTADDATEPWPPPKDGPSLTVIPAPEMTSEECTTPPPHPTTLSTSSSSSDEGHLHPPETKVVQLLSPTTGLPCSKEDLELLARLEFQNK